MANHKSSKKRIIRNKHRSEINISRLNRIRTFIKKVENEITAKDYEKANFAFKTAMPELQKGVSKGVLHKKTASRKLSRLSNRIKLIKS